MVFVFFQNIFSFRKLSTFCEDSFDKDGWELSSSLNHLKLIPVKTRKFTKIWLTIVCTVCAVFKRVLFFSDLYLFFSFIFIYFIFSLWSAKLEKLQRSNRQLCQRLPSLDNHMGAQFWAPYWNPIDTTAVWYRRA